jgi:hypothetical protein
MARKWLVGAVVAAALLSAATAASAGATTTEICQDSPCSNPWAKNSVFEGTGELHLGFIASCTSTSFEFEITGAGGGPSQEGEFLTYPTSGCTPAGCTVTELNTPWVAQVTVNGTGPGGTAKVTASGTGPGFESHCGSLTCLYTTSAMTVSIVGGSSPLFKVSSQALSLVLIGSSPGCEKTTTLTTLHEVSPVKGTGGFWIRM